MDNYLEFCYSDYYQDGQISGMASLTDCSQMDSLASVELRQRMEDVLCQMPYYECDSKNLAELLPRTWAPCLRHVVHRVL